MPVTQGTPPLRCIIRLAVKILCLLLLCADAYAQVPGMKIYTQLDGFPGTIGYLLHQDDNGFIWIATDNGVARFDGQRFKVIDEQDGLVDKEILAALPNPDGRVLFVPLLNNVSYYEKGRVVTAAQNAVLKSLHNTEMNRSEIDPESRYAWLCDGTNYHGIYMLGPDTIQWKSIELARPFSIMTLIGDTAYISLRSPTPNIHAEMGMYNLVKHQYTPLMFEGKLFRADGVMRYSNNGRYLGGCIGKNLVKVFRRDGDQVKLVATFTSQKAIFDLRFDANNHLWVMYDGRGVEYWGPVDQINKGRPPFHIMDQIQVNDVLVDRDQNLWFTTQHRGLHFISARHWTNALLTHDLQLTGNIPWSICGNEDQDIYIGNYIVPQLTIISQEKTKVVTLNGDVNYGLRCIEHAQGLTLAASRSVLHKVTSQGSRIHSTDFFMGSSIKDIAIYSPDTIILAGHERAKYITLSEGQNPRHRSIFLGRTTAVKVLPDKSILIGTPNGLYCKSSLQLPPIKIKDSVLSQAHITDISQMGAHTLVGTSVQGLYRYTSRTGKIKRITLNGFNSGSIRQIYVPNDSACWLATDRGAWKLIFDRDLGLKAITNFTFFEGLPSSNVSGIYIRKDTAYIATSAGIGILPLNDSTRVALAPPKVFITSARLNDSLMYFPQQVNVGYWQNDIEVSLSAIGYESIGNIRYLYRLEGLSQKWVQTESPEISFSGLSPGQYRLLVYAVNYKGIKSAEPSLLSITIRPAFWQTLWFYILLVFVLAGLMFAVLYWWISRNRNKQFHDAQQKRRLAELELEAIKAQINPHFIYNCLNSIQFFNYKNEHEYAKQYLDLFAKLIRQTMRYSQETFITLEEETDYLNNYLQLEKMRFKDKLSYSIHIQPVLRSTTLLPAMLVQPYVENALKHGIAKMKEKGRVDIRFEETSGGWLRVTISDNGPGMPASYSKGDRKPLGLRISGTRATAYNQLFQLGIQVATNPGGAPALGTMIELLIPPIIYENTQVQSSYY